MSLSLYRVEETTPPPRRVPGYKRQRIMATLENVKELAKSFLAIADELNEKVSAYIDGSDKDEDANAYWIVREADKKFIDAVNEYYEESYKCGLNYELAESFI